VGLFFVLFRDQTAVSCPVASEGALWGQDFRSFFRPESAFLSRWVIEGSPQKEDAEMTNQQKNQITVLRSQGFGYATIAKAVGLQKGAVVAYCRKIGLTGTKATDNSRIDVDADFCLQCGALLTQTSGRKRIKFCCNKCRITWWNSHPEKVNRKAVYSFTCANCGKSFTAYGNAGRKYCSHACYIADRFKGGDGDE